MTIILILHFQAPKFNLSTWSKLSVISMYEDEKACYVVFIAMLNIDYIYLCYGLNLGSSSKDRKVTLLDPVSLFPSPYCIQTSHLVIASV